MPRNPSYGVEAVLFDAVGTLIHPDPPAAEVYHRLGRKHGAGLSREEVASRFRDAFRQVFSDAAETSDELERVRWREVVGCVFQELSSAAVEPLFAELWSHFAESSNWSLYSDVPRVWRALESRGYRLGVASNYDDRLPGVLAGHPPLDGCRRVFWSSQLGYNKPDRRFFAAIEERLNLPPERILLIGDDYEKDHRGATLAGWQAIHLDRTANGRSGEAISDLAELLELLAPQR